jgi:hypothetical protein
MRRLAISLVAASIMAGTLIGTTTDARSATPAEPCAMEGFAWRPYPADLEGLPRAEWPVAKGDELCAMRFSTTREVGGRSLGGRSLRLTSPLSARAAEMAALTRRSEPSSQSAASRPPAQSCSDASSCRASCLANALAIPVLQPGHDLLVNAAT